MKKKQPRSMYARPQHAARKDGKEVGIVSGTPADSFDEAAELKYDKKVAIYISPLAVLLAVAATGSNDAMKSAQQAGFQVFRGEGVLATY